MIRSLPIVATKTGGMAEVVRDGVEGLLVPPDDASALRSAIATLRDDPALARELAERARVRAMSYTWDVQAPLLQALLFGVAGLEGAAAPRAVECDSPAAHSSSLGFAEPSQLRGVAPAVEPATDARTSPLPAG
jgi:hypothetical protein